MSIGPCTYFATALVCFDDGAGNRTTLVAHYEYAKSVIGSSIIRATRFTLPDGLTVVDTSTGTVTAGACPIVVAPRVIDATGINLANGSLVADFDPAGNGASWSYSGANRLQSVTVTCLRGDKPSTNTVQVVSGSTGTRHFLIAGQSVTFSVAQDVSANEELEHRVSVDCIGDSACHIAWTEELP